MIFSSKITVAVDPYLSHPNLLQWRKQACLHSRFVEAFRDGRDDFRAQQALRPALLNPSDVRNAG
jgi:hypothetical protein